MITSFDLEEAVVQKIDEKVRSLGLPPEFPIAPDTPEEFLTKQGRAALNEYLEKKKQYEESHSRSGVIVHFLKSYFAQGEPGRLFEEQLATALPIVVDKPLTYSSQRSKLQDKLSQDI